MVDPARENNAADHHGKLGAGRHVARGVGYAGGRFAAGLYLIYSSLNKTTTEGGASLPYYWEAVTGGTSEREHGRGAHTRPAACGQCGGITPTTLIGRDASGDIGHGVDRCDVDAYSGRFVGCRRRIGYGDECGAGAAGVDIRRVRLAGDYLGHADGYAGQSANQVFAGPLPAAPTPAFRALVAGDIQI